MNNQIETAIALHDRATQAALNFVGHSISSSDGSYELLIDVIKNALIEQAYITMEALDAHRQVVDDFWKDAPRPCCAKQALVAAKAERDECLKICADADKSTHPAELADKIRARDNPAIEMRSRIDQGISRLLGNPNSWEIKK